MWNILDEGKSVILHYGGMLVWGDLEMWLGHNSLSVK